MPGLGVGSQEESKPWLLWSACRPGLRSHPASDLACPSPRPPGPRAPCLLTLCPPCRLPAPPSGPNSHLLIRFGKD
jgi:hypothetical protein